MGAENSYTKTTVAAIGSTLKGLFSALEGQDGGYKRSANTNMILLLGGAADLDKIEGLLESLSLTHPSRFFLVYNDTKLSAVETSVAAKCLLVAKAEHVCCEVVRIGLPSDKFVAQAKSIIQANLLTGMSTDLYIYEPSTSTQTIDLLTPLADHLFFDSCAFEQDRGKIDHISRRPANIVDFEWIRLADWRDAVKAIFDRSAVTALIPFTRSIKVLAKAGNAKSSVSMAGLLFAGWLVSKLKLSVRSYGKDCYECFDERGRKVLLGLNFASGGSEPSKVLEMAFHFERQSSHSGEPHILFEREAGNKLEIFVDLGGQSFNTSRNLDTCDLPRLVVRYFSVGESIANYRAALQRGLELDSLRSNS